MAKPMYHQLPSGMRLGYFHNPHLPATSIAVYVEGGGLQDPIGKQGTASFVAALLGKGYDSVSPFECAKALESLGARFATFCTYQTFGFSLQVLSEYLNPAMDLLHNFLQNPMFPEEELEKEKKVILTQQLQKRQEPYGILSDAVRLLLYPGHRVQKPTEGDEKSIPAICQRDLLEWYQKYFCLSRGRMSIVSDKPFEEILLLVENFVQGLPVESPARLEYPPLPEHEHAKIIAVHLPVNQVFVQMAGWGIHRKTPDFNACRIWNYILGGGFFASRLFRTLRVEQGLAYSVYSQLTAGREYFGKFSLGWDTHIPNLTQSLNSVKKVVGELQAKGVRTSELRGAQSFFLGSLPRFMETSSQWSRIILDGLFYDLPKEYWRKDLKEIRQMDRQTVNQSLQSFFSARHLHTILVTDLNSASSSLPPDTKLFPTYDALLTLIPANPSS